MKIFVVNCGSSSLKYQLIDMDTNEPIATGLADRIATGAKGALSYKPVDKEPVKLEVDLPDHTTAINLVIEFLTDPVSGVIASLSEIAAVGHRIVHGGQRFFESTLIDESVIKAIEECIPMSPLHNPANLLGIAATRKALPNVPQVACFDTAFHQTMPERASIYPIPYELYEKYHIRKYGFHGTSHRYVSSRAIEMLGGGAGKKIVTCHLGNGASCAAV
ncbi:MAG: acetate kinase, partial [Eubacteriaceae bacterium]|nr:acetate kinase [Eubacteriaceae bacterium]